MKSKEAALKRINRIMNWNALKGINKESVNLVYRKIISQRL